MEHDYGDAPSTPADGTEHECNIHGRSRGRTFTTTMGGGGQENPPGGGVNICTIDFPNAVAGSRIHAFTKL